VRRKAFATLVALGCAAAPVGAAAQSLLATRVRADNDAFDFWVAPWSRPDEEYTSGVRGTLEYAGEPWWNAWLLAPVPHCGTGAGARCSTKAFTIGQDIYTAARGAGDRGTAPGSRPNAGWLFLEESGRVATAGRLDESGIALGVTGEPALARVMQRVAHGYAAAYNRPVDWSHQLPAEPGLVIRYERTQRLRLAGSDAGFGMTMEPHAGGSLGNILTEAKAGARMRLGFGVRHPWLPVASPREAGFSLFADATMHGVVRNEFLAGTMFRASEHVRERPWVSTYEAGFTLRWRQLAATYRANRVAPEYFTRTQSHAWSSVEAEWRVVP
jgi:hypothetical protein